MLHYLLYLDVPAERKKISHGFDLTKYRKAHDQVIYLQHDVTHLVLAYN